ncbi:hypothetical protein BH11PSE2_BH11PSE2_17380 [soil metagenome]
MIRPAVITLAALLLATPALAQPPAAPAAAAAAADGPKFSVAKTTIGTIMGDPAAKAVFAKSMPELAANPDLQQGYEMTLPDIVQFVPELTPEKLKEIDTELAKIK